MKLATVFSIIIAVAAGSVAMPASDSWMRPLDAQPEALVIGASLLVLASLLRHGLPQKGAK